MIDFDYSADEIGISVEAYKKLCALFLTAMEEDTSGLRDALESEDTGEIRRRAHHIKGAAANLEFTVLSLKAEELQNAALKENIELLRSVAENLYTEYRKIKTELKDKL